MMCESFAAIKVKVTCGLECATVVARTCIFKLESVWEAHGTMYELE